jgi:hypothetical protein
LEEDGVKIDNQFRNRFSQKTLETGSARKALLPVENRIRLEMLRQLAKKTASE